MTTHIADIATYQPETAEDNLALARRLGFEEGFVRDKIGILRRPVLPLNQAVSDMAVAAAEALFARHPDRRSEVGALVLVTQNPDYRLPAVANLVQHRLGLPTSCAAFDLNQGCSGYVYGLGVLKALMEQSGMTVGLLITADNYSRVVNPDDRNTALLFADGASATLLERGEKPLAIGRFTYGSDGAGAEHLILRGGGSRHPDEVPRGPHALHMNGRAIFEFSQRMVPLCIADCLARNGLSASDVDLFLLHQASAFMVQTLRQRLSLPDEKVPIRLEETGNTVSSSIPILIDRLGGVAALAGKTCVLCGFGVGLSWAATVLSGARTT